MLPRAVSVLVTPPVLEPLTLAQGKLRAGLDWADGDARDALMLGFIQAARAKVERDTGIALLTQTVDLFLDAIPSGPLALPWRPVQSAVVTAITAAGVPTVVDASQYLIDAASVAPIPARLGLAEAGAWPTDLRARQPWTIRLVLGFTSVALLQAAAPPLVHAVGLLTAHYATVGRDIAAVGHIVAENPYGYDDLIAPYELVTLA